jgi:hypothetical protein
MTQRLTDLEITRVSLVDKGANAKRLAVLKRDEEGSMTDPPEAPAGVIAWLRKALGIDSVVKSAVPTADAAMRSHLAAKTPSGHGLGDIAVANMSMAAMEKKHTAAHAAGADHSHTVAKTATFAEVVAGQELTDALSDSFYTLQDVLWSVVYAYDEAGQALSLEAKTALVAQDLDEFKSYLLAQMASVTVAKSDLGSAEQRELAAWIRKIGKKISGSRLERLTAAADALNSVLVEVAEVKADEAAETAEEVEVDKAEMVAAFTEALAPIAKSMEALAAASKPVAKVDDGAGAGAGDEAPVTIEDRLDTIEKILLDGVQSQGVRKSLVGQDGGVEVKKASVFAGIM